jgi:hypothetical protein
MSQDLQSNEFAMNDRRGGGGDRPGVERRQFADGRSELSPEARELADAVDSYKRTHRRRFITHEEMVAVIKSLGYHK